MQRLKSLAMLARIGKIVALVAAFSRPLVAQSDRAGETSMSDAGWMFAIIGGPGVTTPTPLVFTSGDTLYRTRKRPMMFEVEVSKTLRRSSGNKLFYEYFVASQPVMSVGGNVRYTYEPCRSCAEGLNIVEQRYTSYGMGISPVGVRAVFPLPFSSRLALSGQAGAVYLSRAIPYPIGTRFNFHFSARPELTVPINRLGRLTAGYEFFHVSNGNTGKVNPGINGGIYMVGFQRGTR